MLPYLIKDNVDCGMSLGISFFCGLKDCGHRCLDLELNLFLWKINLGIEF